MQGTYNALNTQLMMELPVLTRCGIEVLSLATRSLISARMYLQGHLARLYLNLAQVTDYIVCYSGLQSQKVNFTL